MSDGIFSNVTFQNILQQIRDNSKLRIKNIG